MQLQDIMTRGVECLKPTDTLQRAAQQMRDLDVGSLPVCGEDGKLAGIITDRDITIRGTAEGRDVVTEVRTLMTPEVAYCFEDEQIEDAAKVMEQKQIRRLLVLDRNKRLTGILSLGDLAVRGDDSLLSAAALEEISEPVGA
jgi:CBS domain-containing protein